MNGIKKQKKTNTRRLEPHTPAETFYTFIVLPARLSLHFILESRFGLEYAFELTEPSARL